MELRECYVKCGGDYEDALSRLMNKEAFVKRLLLKFPDDGSFLLLKTSIDGGDAETAFRAAHTLKGVAQNLSLTKLGSSASALTEALRGGSLTDDVPALMLRVSQDYAVTLAAINEYREKSEN